MKDTFFLVLDRNGVVRLRKSEPKLSGGQFSVRVNLRVDDRFFKQIIPTANIELDDKFLIEPKVELQPLEKPIEESSVRMTDVPVSVPLGMTRKEWEKELDDQKKESLHAS